MAFIRKKPAPKKRKPILNDLFEEEYEFEGDELRDALAVDANKALQEYRDAPIRLKLQKAYLWRREIIRAVYRHVDPKEIPLADLKIIAHHTSNNHMDTKYADKINGPVKAIRAYCINCQGGSASFVRNCTAAHCPLFPFRMGSNPFFGKIANSEVEVTEELDVADPITAINAPGTVSAKRALRARRRSSAFCFFAIRFSTLAAQSGFPSSR